MKFTPKTKEEFVNERLIPAKTICDAEVAKAEEKVSKSSGKPMIEVSLKVYHGAVAIFITDWLVAGSQKLLHFCDCAGLGDAYMRGEVDADMVVGRGVKVKVGVDPAKDGYQARNKVADYVLPKPSQSGSVGSSQSARGLGVPESQRQAAMAATKPDDEIPF